VDPDKVIAAVGLYAATFVIAAVGSVLPVISIEVFLIGVALTVGAADAVPLVALAALGQTLGKLPIYFGTRAVADRAKLDRVRAWAARWHPSVLLATSSVLGLPPFSLLATMAGVLSVRVRTFCIVVVLGRATRFAAIFVFASG
jgi:membrane protein YqaA with SNARE-associated domain